LFGVSPVVDANGNPITITPTPVDNTGNGGNTGGNNNP